MLLLNVPDDIGFMILNDWCAMEDLTLLDSACCDNLSRGWILEVISRHNFTSCGTDYDMNFSCLHWLLLRSVKTKFLNFDGQLESIFIFIRIASIVLDTSKLTTICFQSWSNAEITAQQITKQLNRCPLLTSLVLWHVDTLCDVLLLATNPSILRQLTEIEIRSNETTDFTPVAIFHLAICCRNLISISLNLFDFYGTQQEFCFLFVANPLVENIYLRVPEVEVTDYTIRALSKHCTKLKTLKIKDCTYIGIGAITILQQKCTQLNQIEIHHYQQMSSFHYEIFDKPNRWQISKIVMINIAGNEVTSDGANLLHEYLKFQTDISKLYFCACATLTDKVLETVAANNPNLREISVSLSSNNISPQGMIHLFTRCTFIRQLSLNDVHNFTMIDLINLLCKTSHKLKIINFVRNDVLDTMTVCQILSKNNRCINRL